MSTHTIRTGSQDCSTKKKVSVLIINSLLHAVMSSIHCAGAGFFFFFYGHARGTREGEGPPLLFSPRASLRLLHAGYHCAYFCSSLRLSISAISVIYCRLLCSNSSCSLFICNKSKTNPDNLYARC